MRDPDCLTHQGRRVCEGWTEEAILKARLFPADAREVLLLGALSLSHKPDSPTGSVTNQLQCLIQMKKKYFSAICWQK